MLPNSAFYEERRTNNQNETSLHATQPSTHILEHKRLKNEGETKAGA